MSADTTPPPRSRVRNPARTRAAIIDAAVASLDRGVFAPTTAVLAREAGVSERSIFVHFTTLDEIRLAAAAARGADIDAVLEPVDPAAPLGERLDELLRQREIAYPLQTNLRIAELALAPRSPELSSQAHERRVRLREQLSVALRVELEAAADAGDALELIEALTDWPMRHQFVTRQGLDQAAASALIRTAVLAALRPGDG